MKPLDEQSITQRIVTTAIIVIVVILLLALLGFCTGGWENAQAQPRSEPTLVLILPPSPWDREMLDLDRQALREAYVEKMKQLFNVWVREAMDAPERPVKGAAQTRRAFIEIMKVYEARAQELEQRDSK